MTKNQKIANELYEKIDDKNKVSEEFFYNALCYFELKPEEVADVLNKLPLDKCKGLESSFSIIRSDVKEILSNILSNNDFSEKFHDPEMEDILFYQVAHGQPIH